MGNSLSSPQGQKKEDVAIETARQMLQGNRDTPVDASAAVALLEELVDARASTNAIWMLGVCYEYGIGTTQDLDRAVQLYKYGAEKGNAAAELLRTTSGRGCTKKKLGCEWGKTHDFSIEP